MEENFGEETTASAGPQRCPPSITSEITNLR